MRVTILQSNYLPWCGYFNLIANSDLFIFLDEVQFTKNDWRNRNRIKTSSGAQWLSIPCGSNINRTIDEVIVNDSIWANKHYKSIMQNYGKTRHFDDFGPVLREFFDGIQPKTRLSYINQTLIKQISGEVLKLNCEFINSSNLQASSEKNIRLINLLKSVNADQYLTGPSAKNYIDADCFQQHGIKVIFASYADYGPYTQQFGEFIPNLSVVDAIFNVGRDTTKMFTLF